MSSTGVASLGQIEVLRLPHGVTKVNRVAAGSSGGHQHHAMEYQRPQSSTFFLHLTCWRTTFSNDIQKASVWQNDIYVTLDPTEAFTRVTFNGSPNQFNGIADWVYEEEVLSASVALHWSPETNYIAYLSLNETFVQTYTYPIYGFDRPDHQLPVQEQIRYPKSGTPNPVAEVYIYNVQAKQHQAVDLSSHFEPEDRIVSDLKWYTDATAMVKVMDRRQNVLKVLLADAKTGATTLLREEKKDNEKNKGWVEDVTFFHSAFFHCHYRLIRRRIVSRYLYRCR